MRPYWHSSLAYIFDLFNVVYEIIVAPAISAAYSIFDLAISWRWSMEPAPLVAKMTGIFHRREIMKNMTRSSPRLWGNTGFYMAASPA